MKVKVKRIQELKKTDENNDIMTSLHRIAYQMIIWSRITPFRKGLDDSVASYRRLLDSVIDSKEAYVLSPQINNDDSLIMVVLDMLNDGKVYDMYDISSEEDGVYAEIFEMKEITQEEFESNNIRTRNAQMMLDMMQF